MKSLFKDKGTCLFVWEMSRGPYDKSKVKNYPIRSRNRDVMFFFKRARVFILQLESK